MKIEEKKDKDFQNPFLEIDGFLYKVSNGPTDFCAARLVTTEGKSGQWHLYRVIGMNGNDLHLEYNNNNIHVSFSTFRNRGRIVFVERVKTTSYGLDMPTEKIPDSNMTASRYW